MALLSKEKCGREVENEHKVETDGNNLGEIDAVHIVLVVNAGELVLLHIVTLSGAIC